MSSKESDLLFEHRLEIARWCGTLWDLRLVSENWGLAANAAVKGMSIKWPCEVPTAQKVVKRLSRLELLSFQRATPFNANDLESIIDAVSPTHALCIDMTLAMPLLWPGVRALQEKVKEGFMIRFLDTLQLRPSPSLSAVDVVTTQAYGLHAGRVDVCFAFASPQNAEATGPLERFEQFFHVPSSPYSCMLHCDRFETEELPTASGNIMSAQSFLVKFWAAGSSVPVLFQWNVTKQEENEFEGCWMTDAVVQTTPDVLLWGDAFLEE